MQFVESAQSSDHGLSSLKEDDKQSEPVAIEKTRESNKAEPELMLLDVSIPPSEKPLFNNDNEVTRRSDEKITESTSQPKVKTITVQSKSENPPEEPIPIISPASKKALYVHTPLLIFND